MFIFTVFFVTKSLYSARLAYLMTFRFSANMQGSLVENSQRIHWMFFKHSVIFSHHIINTQMCPQNNFWTITVCDLKQVLTRYGFLTLITLVSVPKLFWQSHSGGRKKILNHFHYLNLLQRRLISYTRSHQLFLLSLHTPMPSSLLSDYPQASS